MHSDKMVNCIASVDGRLLVAMGQLKNLEAHQLCQLGGTYLVAGRGEFLGETSGLQAPARVFIHFMLCNYAVLILVEKVNFGERSVVSITMSICELLKSR